MFFIDRMFLKRHLPTIMIHQTVPPIKIRGIGSKIHDDFEYVIIDIYLPGKIDEKRNMTHIKTEFHLINKLKVNILIDMNVMRSENMILNFEKKIFIISTCQNMKIPIFIQRKSASINRMIRAVI